MVSNTGMFAALICMRDATWVSLPGLYGELNLKKNGVPRSCYRQPVENMLWGTVVCTCSDSILWQLCQKNVLFQRVLVIYYVLDIFGVFEPSTFSVAGAITSLNNAVAVPSIITVWLLVFYSKQMPLDMPRPGYKITMMPTKELLQTKKVWISGRLFSFWLPLSILLSSESHWLTSKKHEFMQVVWC